MSDTPIPSRSLLANAPLLDGRDPRSFDLPEEAPRRESPSTEVAYREGLLEAERLVRAEASGFLLLQKYNSSPITEALFAVADRISDAAERRTANPKVKP